MISLSFQLTFNIDNNGEMFIVNDNTLIFIS